jgi:IS4 transposase
MCGERFSARGHARRSGACGELPPRAPQRLIADRANDSDPLDAEKGIELIAPHRRNRKKAKTQDGRKLRRYKRRWKIERLFAWLGNFRAL